MVKTERWAGALSQIHFDQMVFEKHLFCNGTICGFSSTEDSSISHQDRDSGVSTQSFRKVHRPLTWVIKPAIQQRHYKVRDNSARRALVFNGLPAPAALKCFDESEFRLGVSHILLSLSAVLTSWLISGWEVDRDR